MVQCELERVLYPVFIHCYLDLVGSRVAAGEAQKFMTENKHRFVEAGNQSSNRRQQVRDAQATRRPLTLSHTQGNVGTPAAPVVLPVLEASAAPACLRCDLLSHSYTASKHQTGFATSSSGYVSLKWLPHIGAAGESLCYVLQVMAVLNGCLTLPLQEIQDLSSVSVPEHIDANRTARAAQEQRYPVKLTQYGLHLLMHFLQSAKLFQILSIVNRRVDIQVKSVNRLHKRRHADRCILPSCFPCAKAGHISVASECRLCCRGTLLRMSKLVSSHLSRAAEWKRAFLVLIGHGRTCLATAASMRIAAAPGSCCSDSNPMLSNTSLGHLQVTDGFGKPADGVDGSAEISLLLGAQHIEMQTVNTKPLMLSLLQVCLSPALMHQASPAHIASPSCFLA